MADFPYSPMPSTIKRFFGKIQSVGKPEKVTQKYIESIGFKSKNDRSLTPILKAIGFVDSSGTPSPLWQRYRNKAEAPAVLAQAIRSAYPALFAVYADANRKDDEALRNFFTSHTSVADKTVGYMVRTFKTLSELADFEASPPDISTPAPASAPSSPATTITATAQGPRGTTINVNIQLTLPETKDAAVYDTIFASLKKHLLP